VVQICFSQREVNEENKKYFVYLISQAPQNLFVRLNVFAVGVIFISREGN
jgi:hypothetical protein